MEKPTAIDMSLCINDFCPNKCKRHQMFWEPNNPQSYIIPTIKWDKDGYKLPCKYRMEVD